MLLTTENKQSTPISKDLATELCAAYKKLTGIRSVGPDGSMEVIETVAVSPCDKLNQWFFFNFYLQCRDAKKALEFYHYPEHTVIAIVRHQNADDEISYSYKNLDELKPLLKIAAHNG